MHTSYESRLACANLLRTNLKFCRHFAEVLLTFQLYIRNMIRRLIDT